MKPLIDAVTPQVINFVNIISYKNAGARCSLSVFDHTLTLRFRITNLGFVLLFLFKFLGISIIPSWCFRNSLAISAKLLSALCKLTLAILLLLKANGVSLFVSRNFVFTLHFSTLRCYVFKNYFCFIYG